jgi:hypothetical protein
MDTVMGSMWRAWVGARTGVHLPSHGYSGPDEFHDAEGPCTGQKAIGTRQSATICKRENESTVSGLKGVHHHHQGHCDCSEGG